MNPDRIPLVVAVVGHRDPRPAALPRLRQALAHDLQALITALPQTPLLMLNGLASGMDSEAAEVFLALRDQQAGSQEHRLVAALPKHPQAYRQDFAPGDELERFERLLQACDAVLHPGNCLELRGDAPLGHGLPSPQCYGQQGLFLVRHAFLVFAFNNGVETMEIGGTSQTVALQNGEVHPLFLSVEEVIAALEPGALIEYDTPRFKNQLPAGIEQPPRRCWLQARPCSELSDLLAIPRRIDQFNRAMASKPATPEQQATAAERLHHRRIIAVVLLGLSLSLVLALLPWPYLALSAMVAAVLLAPTLLRASNRQAVVRRCLSEALTIQERWCVMGLPLDTADLLQSRMHPALHWVRSLLRGRRLQWLCQPLHSGELTDASWKSTHLWMVNTLQVLERRSQRLQHREQQSLGLLVVLGLAAAVAAMSGWVGIVPICLAMSAALLAYRCLVGPFASSGRSRRRAEQLRRCLRAYEQALLTPPADPDRLQRLRCALEAVGRDTIDELNDWVSRRLSDPA